MRRLLHLDREHPSARRAVHRSWPKGVLHLVLGATFVLAGCRSKAAPHDAGAPTDEVRDAAPLPPKHLAVQQPPIADEAAPSAGPELTLRMKHLLEAVAQGSPELASDILFPRDAYLALRDTPDPASAWDRKVQTPFARDIDRMHRRTAGIARAQFVGFELTEAPVLLVPKTKEFKKVVYRVKRTALTYSIDGKPERLVIAEMTSWRGAWYVTKLR